MDFKEAIGAIIAGIVLLLPAIKWLISDWAKKAEKIEVLKEKNTAKALDRLEDEVKSFRGAIDNIRAQLRSMDASMSAHRSDIATLKIQLKDTSKALDLYAKGSSENIRNQIKSEVTNLTKQLMMIRNKKNGV